MLGVVGEQRPTKRQQLAHSRVRDAVIHGAVLAPGVHEPAPAQAPEVIGQVRAAQRQRLGQLSDRQLTALTQQLEHSQTISSAPTVFVAQALRRRSSVAATRPTVAPNIACATHQLHSGVDV